MTIRVEQDRWGPGTSEFDELSAYLERAKPGDAFDVWRFDHLCRKDNVLASRKRPDTDGAVPAGGPY